MNAKSTDSMMEGLPPESERRSPPRRGDERRAHGRGKRPERNRRHGPAKREPTGGTSNEKGAPVENETQVKTTAPAKVATKNTSSAKPKLEQRKPKVNNQDDVQGSGQRSAIPEDQLPAFLLRPVILPLKSPKKKQDSAAETDPVS